MRLSNGLRAGLIALTALFGVSASTAAMADSGPSTSASSRPAS